MKNSYDILTSQDGSVVALGLMLLAILTLLGISAFQTSLIDIDIVRNEEIYTNNVYMAEGLAMQATQRLQDEIIANLRLISGGRPAWLYFNRVNDGGVRYDIPGNDTAGSDITDDDVTNVNNWVVGGVSRDFIAVERISGSTSLDMTKPIMHEYVVYARSNQGGREVIIEVGYRRKF